MKRSAKKKSAPKKAAKKPAATKRKTAAKAGTKTSVSKASRPTQPSAAPYTPKPIEGVGWPAFRYPLQ